MFPSGGSACWLMDSCPDADAKVGSRSSEGCWKSSCGLVSKTSESVPFCIGPGWRIGNVSNEVSFFGVGDTRWAFSCHKL
jgi:hypothetical protein